MRPRAAAAAALVTAAIGGAAFVTSAGPSDIAGGAVASEQAERFVADRFVGSPTVGGCPIFPNDNAWNQRVDGHRLHPASSTIVSRILADGGDFLHPDFGENPLFGIPYVVVPSTEPEVPVDYAAFGSESDPGPFPLPLDAPIEGGSSASGDRHAIALRQGTCELFELYRAVPGASRWTADSGARFDLRSNALRPLGWTSADAAGLPILPGLVRYEEVAAGEIRHAIRITFRRTRRAYVLPATHFASSDPDPALPPMGLRLRLSADYDLSGVTGQSRVIAEAMKTYGVIVADNGSNWFFQGAPSPGWDDDDLNQLKNIPGSAFEVVDTGPAITG